MATDDLYRLYLPGEACRDGYPVAWHETLKHAVREAAGNRCIRCLHPYKCGEKRADKGEWTACDEQCRHDGPVRSPYIVGEEPITEAQWRILTVHHLDGDKLNCRWWNLAALCQRCHLTIQGRVNMQQHWAFEHSGWFKPHAAGYYAHRMGLELTREQVMERLEELLAIGQGREFPSREAANCG